MESEQRLGRRETLLEGIIEQAKKMPRAHYDTLAAFMVAESIMPEGYRAFSLGQYTGDVQGFSLGLLAASFIEHCPFLVGNNKPREFYASVMNIFRYLRNFGIIMAGMGAKINGGSGDLFGCLFCLACEGFRAGLDYKMEDFVAWELKKNLTR